MIAFLAAGLILGVLALVLRHGEHDPGPVVTVLVGVVGAVVGGSGMNLVLGESLADLDAWSFTAACLVSFAVLGLLEAGIGRKR